MKTPASHLGLASWSLIALGMALVLLTASVARAATQGEWVQTDNLGMNLISHDYTTGKTKTVSDAQKLSVFTGLLYYVTDTLRLGMNLQFTEQLGPTPPSGQSRFQTFALLPQVGWNFLDPFFAALIFTCAPRNAGEDKLDLGFQLLVGAGVAVSQRVRANLALEIPWNFYIHETLGLTPLAGISVRL